MAACCLIGTKPGEVKAFWYDTDKNEWKNFAADQRNSQVQVVKEANILYLRVIPDDKSPVSCRELRVHLLLHPLLHIGVQIPNS